MARTGRPRGFDKDAAVDQAMRLFWQCGFDSTSLSDLKAAMGDISPASFYAAFGSKEGLFRQVLARYLDTHGRVMAPLHDPGSDPREAIERTLRQSARMQTDATHPFGCLVVLAAATVAVENQHVQACLAEERRRNREGLLACVRRAITAGSLPADTDPVALATMFESFLLGLSMQARDGVKLEALEAGICRLMQVWDGLAMGCFHPTPEPVATGQAN